jgi:hypothetical protein
MDFTSTRQLTWDKERKEYVPASRSNKFLKGPVPWEWISEAAKLPGKALHVGLALWRLKGAMKSDTVRLGNSEVAALGVDRNAKSRALKHLQERGLITVKQEPGKLPVVTLITELERARPQVSLSEC